MTKIRESFGTMMMTSKDKRLFSSFLITNRLKLHPNQRKRGQPLQKFQKHIKVKVNNNKFRKKEPYLKINKDKGNQSKLMRKMKRRMTKRKASTGRRYKPKKPRKKRELPSSNIPRT